MFLKQRAMPSIHLAAIACAALCALAARSERSDSMLDLDDVNRLESATDPQHFIKTHTHAQQVHEALDTLKKHTAAARDAAKQVHQELGSYQGQLHQLREVLGKVKDESTSYETAVIAHLKENEKQRLLPFANLPWEKKPVVEDESVKPPEHRPPEHHRTDDAVPLHDSFVQLGDEGRLSGGEVSQPQGTTTPAGAVVASSPEGQQVQPAGSQTAYGQTRATTGEVTEHLKNVGDELKTVAETGGMVHQGLEKYQEHVKQLKEQLAQLEATATAYGLKVVEFFDSEDAKRTQPLQKIQEELQKLRDEGRKHGNKPLEDKDHPWSKTSTETTASHMETSSTGTDSSGSKVPNKKLTAALLERGATAAAQQVSAKVTAHGALHQAPRHTQSR